MSGYTDLPLDLPHAGTIAKRIADLVESSCPKTEEKYIKLNRLAQQISEMLIAYRVYQEDPPEEKAKEIQKNASVLGRMLVLEIEQTESGFDRLGELVRNFFECLAFGKEGAEISLRAGENPNSLLRPE